MVDQQGRFFTLGVLDYRQNIKRLGRGVLAFSILLAAYYGFSYVVLGSLLILLYLFGACISLSTDVFRARILLVWLAHHILCLLSSPVIWGLELRGFSGYCLGLRGGLALCKTLVSQKCRFWVA